MYKERASVDVILSEKSDFWITAYASYENGISSGISIKITNSTISYVKYELIKRKFTGRYTLELSCDTDIVMPAFEVRGEFGRIPQSKNSGRRIIESNSVTFKRGKISLNITNSDIDDRNLYRCKYRLFLKQDEGTVRIIHPTIR